MVRIVDAVQILGSVGFLAAAGGWQAPLLVQVPERRNLNWSRRKRGKASPQAV
jgi:hypothetical protein